MRKMKWLWVALVCGMLFVAGCWLVEPQEVDLTPQQVAMLEAKLGDLVTADTAEARVEIEKLLDSYLESFTVGTGENGKPTVEVVLEEPLLEAGKKAGKSIAEGWLANPTTSGGILGLLNGFYAFAGVLTGRARMRK